MAIVECDGCTFLVTLGDCCHLVGLELGGSLRGFCGDCLPPLIELIVRGSYAHPCGRSRRATLVECSWLVGVLLAFDSCGTQVVGLA